MLRLPAAVSLVTSNAQDNGMWHLAVAHEMRTAVTKRLMKVYFHARCTGRSLGGSYGSTQVKVWTLPSNMCPRCAALYAKAPDPSLVLQLCDA